MYSRIIFYKNFGKKNIFFCYHLKILIFYIKKKKKKVKRKRIAFLKLSNKLNGLGNRDQTIPANRKHENLMNTKFYSQPPPDSLRSNKFGGLKFDELENGLTRD